MAWKVVRCEQKGHIVPREIEWYCNNSQFRKLDDLIETTRGHCLGTYELLNLIDQPEMQFLTTVQAECGKDMASDSWVRLGVNSAVTLT
jgi:hypothetical protein